MRIALKWSIQLAAFGIAILAVFWILMMLSAGLSMGWSGRSSIQIALLIILGLVLPTGLTAALAGKAINFSKQERLGHAAACLVVALVPITGFYLAEIWRWL